MDDFSPSDLKTILHSKRANLYYLEHCRVLVNGGRVEYVTDAGKRSLYWNIPIANTTCLLLGTGTSITQAAMRDLARAGVMVGFCGGGGTPLYAATEGALDIAWLSPQSEYRPTEYLQQWVGFWFDESARLAAAKTIQRIRLDQLRTHWLKDRGFADRGFAVPVERLEPLLRDAYDHIAAAADVNALLTTEARMTKRLFKLAAQAANYGDFVRAKRGTGTDSANRFLDHGNYLAYGLGATATWVLGLPHGLAVLHGKTRRGGLVFDAADLIKDALILPQAFLSAMHGDDEQGFRKAAIDVLTRAEALDVIIDALKQIALTAGASGQ
ncbi:type I-F CRISPR-associated endonuclease Cas1f [Thiococcus pfennigii]|uniref:type I-F CRISPR-associated endonuclease Cas1f n=1 Tax=Thiococcus pfennigii TaxID=1057 RepID=UPI001908AE0A|nr:type I-F CRISPR-associated endonuclease Cas1f [Thiococcus pfennigii]MBK1700081.1 subtype I-F CRISPR-associated endonuclease Cas1 [Thiococcus pfennigii]MBK1733369.1 subtype I-F CRISPR-associated endonuclease Cas1 [Thiococcus pfennigii]